MDFPSPTCSYEPIKTWTELKNYDELQNFACKHLTIQYKLKHITQKFHQDPVKLKENIVEGSENIGTGTIPKVIVCHDFKGGYGDDKYNLGTQNWRNYTFTHWGFVDIFIYFSHNFITIPPLGWINAAHKHGVKILGTIITEWTDGKIICEQFLADSDTITLTVEKLAQIVVDYGIDGYLINIENEINNEDIDKLREFVSKLHKKLKDLDSKNQVIWYDSVIENGELEWQNELNDKNKLFFDACDGIFLNYNWTDEKLSNSLLKAGNRQAEIFVGVDCFGRNCYGGGGLNTYKAIEKIWNHGSSLSVAIFAPGWSFECNGIEQFQRIDCQLWYKCMKHFGRKVWDLSSSSHECSKDNVQLWSTDFNRGYGHCKFCLGRMVDKSGPWFNLNDQSYQPIFLPHYATPTNIRLDDLQENASLSEDPNAKPYAVPLPVELLLEEPLLIVEYDTSIGFFGGGSLRIGINDPQHKDEFLPFCCIPVQMEFRPNEHLGICIAYKVPNATANKSSARNIVSKINGMQIASKDFRVPVNAFLPLEKENELMLDVSKTVTEIQLNEWNLSCSVYSPIDSKEIPKTSFPILTDIIMSVSTKVENINIGFVSLVKISD